MSDTQSSTEEKHPSFLSKLFIKRLLITISISFWTIIMSYLWIYYYEYRYHCLFKFSLYSPFIECSNEGESYYRFRNWELKPLILLYPQKDTPVEVSLEYTPWFSATYPEYDTTKRWWSVLVHPDGTLIDHWTNQDTYGLFWEGSEHSVNYDLSKWFVVKGSELRNFFYTKLTEIGLNTKEKSDFIMYWYPKLQEYPYIQITFAWEEYVNTAKLSISPTPDSLLRVFMVAKPLENFQSIPEQKIEKFGRKWFSVVEWGGTIVQ
jgi:hypothetical protein